jgi:hypothetical protein
MKKPVAQRIEELHKKAEENGKKHVKLTRVSGNTTSLGKVIKTKKDGEAFMKMLRAL